MIASRFNLPNHGSSSAFTHFDEPKALRDSPTLGPQSKRLVDTHKPNRPSHPASQSRTASPRTQWPKPGVFRTSNINRAEQFPYRAQEGFRSGGGTNGQGYGGRKDYSRQDNSSRQFASPRTSNNDVTLSRRQNNPSTKQSQSNTGRLRDEGFPGRDRDGQVKSDARMVFDGPSSAFRSRSPDQSSSLRSVQSTTHPRYGAEMESDYYDEHYRDYDGERQ